MISFPNQLADSKRWAAFPCNNARFPDYATSEKYALDRQSLYLSKGMIPTFTPTIFMCFPYDHIKRLFNLSLDSMSHALASYDEWGLEFIYNDLNPPPINELTGVVNYTGVRPERHIYATPTTMLNHFLFPSAFPIYTIGNYAEVRDTNYKHVFWRGGDHAFIRQFPYDSLIPPYNTHNMSGLTVSAHRVTDTAFYCPITDLYYGHHMKVLYPAIYIDGEPFESSALIGKIVAIYIEHSNATYFRARSTKEKPLEYNYKFAVNIRSLLPFCMRVEGVESDETNLVNDIIMLLLDPAHYKAIASTVTAFKYRDLEPEVDRNGKPNFTIDKRSGKKVKKYLIPGPVLRSGTSVLVAILTHMAKVKKLNYTVTCKVKTATSDQVVDAVKKMRDGRTTSMSYTVSEHSIPFVRDQDVLTTADNMLSQLMSVLDVGTNCQVDPALVDIGRKKAMEVEQPHLLTFETTKDHSPTPAPTSENDQSDSLKRKGSPNDDKEFRPIYSGPKKGEANWIDWTSYDEDN
jgi:hypothetical protein